MQETLGHFCCRPVSLVSLVSLVMFPSETRWLGIKSKFPCLAYVGKHKTSVSESARSRRAASGLTRSLHGVPEARLRPEESEGSGSEKKAERGESDTNTLTQWRRQQRRATRYKERGAVTEVLGRGGQWVR